MTERPSSWVGALLGGTRSPAGTQAIGRAFRVLRTLSSSGPAGLGLTELARATGLTRPTTHRILAALITESVIVQHARTARYVLQQPFVWSTPAASPPVFAAAAPYLDELAKAIGDTVFVTLRSGSETVCVARRLGSYPIQVLPIDVGARRPLGVSSAGIALLAGMPWRAATRIIAANAAQLRAYGMTARASTEAVRDARQRGFALRERGLIPGTRAISVWFAKEREEAMAALTVAGIARRLPPSRAEEVAYRLAGCAALLESQLTALAPPSRDVAVKMKNDPAPAGLAEALCEAAVLKHR